MTDASVPPASRQSKIWQRTKVGGGLSLFVAGLLALAATPAGPRVVLVVCFALTLGTIFEAARSGILPTPRIGLAVAVAALAPVVVLAGVLDHASQMALPDWGGVERYLWLLVATPVVAGLVFVFGWLPNVGTRDAWSQLPRLLRLTLWLAVPLAGCYPLLLFTGVSGLVALVVLSKVGDIAGYYVGNAIGQTHPFPNVSPGKTTAGCVASFVFAVAAGAACQAGGLFPEARIGILSGILAGAFVNLASQAGDLMESAAKRRARIKDSGTWFGPSGGLLDLVDSLLLSVPVALLTWPFLFRFAYLTEAARALAG